MNGSSRASLGALIPLLFFVHAAVADGRLEGRVTAGDEYTNLQGARVQIEELNRSTSTSRDGRFSFGAVPAGTYTVRIDYLGAGAETAEIAVQDGSTARVEIVVGREMDEIIVFGMSSGNASALNQQRSADNFTSIISADAIGALPDSNVAEAVQRTPGVFLERDQGEGRFIGIRGIDPNLNVTSINGAFVPSPEAGARSVALDVIPSDRLESLEIAKSFTPDMEGSAIGGTVNVRSLSAFDRQGQSMSLSIEGSYNELVEDTSPKIAGSYSDIFSVGEGTDNLGIAVAASWFDREFGSDNVETDGGWTEIEPDTGSPFIGAEEIEQRSYDVTRERIGLAFNLDVQNELSSYYWRNLYSEFSDQEYRTRNEFKFDDGTPVSGDSSSALWEDATVEKEIKDRLEEQTILSTIVGGENYVGQWTIDYSYAYSMSEEKEPNRLDTEFELEEGVDIGYNGIGSKPGLFLGDEAFDPANFDIASFEFLDGIAEDTTNTVAANFTYDIFSDRYNGNIKFGAQHRSRDKDFDAEIEVYDGPDGGTLEPFATPGPRYGLTDFGPGVDERAIRSFFFSNRSSLELDEDDTFVNSNFEDYEMQEDVTAAYLMSTFESGGLRIVYGVRYEDTTFDAAGQRTIINEITGDGTPEAQAVSFSNDYDHVLPSVNVRFERGNVVVRGAATQTIARPNFGELSPGGEIELEDAELGAEIGNPELDAVESTNLDFGVEWYPGGVTMVSAGVFYKDIDNFIVQADVADSIDLTQLIGNIPVDDAEVIQPINGDSADLLGFELMAARQFDNGLFLSANGTFIDSEATYFDRSGKSVLPRTPETVLNGVIGWESDILSLRLAATFKDDSLLGLEELDDPAFDVYQDDHLQLDLSAKWNVTPELQLSFSAINLTDEPYYAYFGSTPFNAQYEEYGRTFSVGLRYTPL